MDTERNDHRAGPRTDLPAAPVPPQARAQSGSLSEHGIGPYQRTIRDVDSPHDHYTQRLLQHLGARNVGALRQFDSGPSAARHVQHRATGACSAADRLFRRGQPRHRGLRPLRCGFLTILGRLVDRCGQTTVLVSGATVTALLLVTIGLLPATTSPSILVRLSAACGAATPPLAACLRTMLPGLVLDPKGLPALYALESTVLELTFIFGPPLALGLGVLWSPGGALAVSGLVMLAATLAFAAQPGSRRWRADPTALRPRGGSLARRRSGRWC